MLGEKATDQVCDAFNERYGLDKPIPVQFGIYLRDVLHGDLGDSFRYGRRCTDILIERLPVTIELALCGADFRRHWWAFRWAIISAVKRNSAVDVGTMVVANVGVSMPVFWLGLDAGLRLCAAAEGHPILAAAVGAQYGGRSPALADRELESHHYRWTGSSRCLMFLSNLHLFNSLVTGNWTGFLRYGQAPDSAGDRAGHDPHGADCAHDPLQPARGAGPGLHPHRACQGPARAASSSCAMASAMP